MKKLLVVILSFFLLTPIVSFTVNGEVLGDPNDLLTVVTPSANQKVGGSINITWYMFDNNQNVIPYKINLYDANTCRTTNFGQINSTNNGISSTTQLNSYTWNTRSTLTTANLVDGNYCLKICLAMKNASTDYSACNARYVRIVNNNRAPVITSIPTNLIIKESDSWQYQIRATDPDNDPITYRIAFGVPFISINQQTGLVSTNGVSKTLPAGVNRADYNIIVSADDNFAGAVSQQFTLTVVKDTSVGVPPPITTPVSTPGGVTSNKPSVINFISPKDGQEFNGTENKISWEASDVDGISSLNLGYSKDANSWTDITKFTGDSIPTEYNWDVTTIEDGDYFLQIVVKDKLGNEVTRISKKFSINNNSTGPDQTNNPLIINLKPQTNSDVTDLRPEIAGDFIPADNAEINPESFIIKLNGQDNKLDCQNDIKGFSCRPKENLSLGLNKVSATIKDTVAREVTIEWSFNVTSENPVSTPVVTSNDETIVLFGREIPRNIFNLILTVCCIAGLLILIPWVLYLLWNGRRKEEITETTTTSYDFNEPTQPVAPITTETTTEAYKPVDTTNYYTPENYSYTDYTYKPETTETVKETVVEPIVETPATQEVKTEEVKTQIETPEPIIAEPVVPVVTPTPVEEKLPEAPKPAEVTTTDTSIDDYYSYVNPSDTTTPTITPATTTETKTDYVEPTETN